MVYTPTFVPSLGVRALNDQVSGNVGSIAKDFFTELKRIKEDYARYALYPDQYPGEVFRLGNLEIPVDQLNTSAFQLVFDDYLFKESYIVEMLVDADKFIDKLAQKLYT